MEASNPRVAVQNLIKRTRIEGKLVEELFRAVETEELGMQWYFEIDYLGISRKVGFFCWRRSTSHTGEVVLEQTQWHLVCRDWDYIAPGEDMPQGWEDWTQKKASETWVTGINPPGTWTNEESLLDTNLQPEGA